MDISEILLLQKDRQLYVRFSNGKNFYFSCEYLRVFSPSAEVKTHAGTINWPRHKETVNITALEPIGNYAIKIYFDDGHQSGIYTFTYFYELMEQYQDNWHRYQKSVQDTVNET